jgi:hypothetical protein
VLSLTHASAGALAGAFITNPVVAFGAGVVIHLVMDKIPHFWPKEKIYQDKLINIDTLISTLFLIALFIYPESRSASIIAGALGGVMVDLYLVIIMKQKGKIAEWHTKRQYHHQEPIWLLTDIAIFIILAAVLGLVIK